MTGTAKAPAKVFFVLPNFAGGGAERVALNLLAHLDRDRFEPHLAVFENQGPLRPLLAEDVKLHSIDRKRLRSALPGLVKLFWQQRPAIVLATHDYVNLALMTVRRAMPAGTKVVLREPLTPSQSIPNKMHPRLVAWAYRRFYRSADLVFCQHHQTEREMQYDFGVPSSVTVALPNPVPLAEIRRRAATPRRRPGAGPRFVAAGRLQRQKGFDRLIRLFAAMPQDAHLTIYGEGEDFGNLAALISELTLESRVVLAGFTDSLPAALAGADACLVSSRWEGLPNIALEALACGTPVIATPESGGIAELAEAAGPGAVTLASLSEGDSAGFLQAMRSKQPQDRRTPSVSLLPAAYELEAVIARFNQHLRQLVQKSANQ